MTDLFTHLAAIQKEMGAAADLARPALARLIDVCRNKSGQSYKIRAFLYSLWNGHPTDLTELVTLDWVLRKDLLAVFLAFGYEPMKAGRAPFFYDAIKAAFTDAGLFDWFIEADTTPKYE